MATTLYGYGPHNITADGDYDVACVGGRDGRQKRLTIGWDRTTGDIVVKSRKHGSAADFVTQSYTKKDETLAAAALAADDVVYVDATDKDIRITGANTSAGELTFAVASEN